MPGTLLILQASMFTLSYLWTDVSMVLIELFRISYLHLKISNINDDNPQTLILLLPDIMLGNYEYLPADKLPPLGLDYLSDTSDSGKINSNIKQRWRQSQSPSAICSFAIPNNSPSPSLPPFSSSFSLPPFFLPSSPLLIPPFLLSLLPSSSYPPSPLVHYTEDKEVLEAMDHFAELTDKAK